MKALKGLFVYLLVLLGIAIMVGVFLGVLMYAFKFKIFGYGVIGNFSSKDVYANYTTALDSDEITVEINVKHFTINVSQTDGEDLKAYYFNHAIGISKGENSTHFKGYDYVETKVEDENTITTKKNSYSPLYYDINGKLIPFDTDKEAFLNTVKANAKKVVIEITEPEGFIWYKDCEVNILLPKDKTYHIIFNGAEGNLNIDSNLTIGTMVLNTTSAITTMVANTQVAEKVFSDLTLKTEDGGFDFTAINKVVIGNDSVLGTLEILECNGGKFLFNEIDAHVKVSAQELNFTAKTINTGCMGFYYDCKEGNLKVDNLYSHGNILDTANFGNIKVGETTYYAPSEEQLTYINSISAENANITLGKVTGDLSFVTTDGNVQIDKVIGTTIAGKTTGIASITTNNGDITIGAIRENAIINSTYGEINVEFYKGIMAYSRYGNINVTNKSYFNNSEINYSNANYQPDSVNYKTILRTADGDISAKDILSPCKIESENKGDIRVTFLPLYDPNKTAELPGEMNVTTKKYEMKTNKGNIHIEIGGATLVQSFVLEISAPRNKVSGKIGSKNATDFLDGAGQVLPNQNQIAGVDGNLYGPKMYITTNSGSVSFSTPYES